MATDKLQEAIKNVDVASKSIQMYSESHPRTLQAIEVAFNHLTSELQSRASLTVSVAEGNLLIEGGTIDKGNPLIERFTKDLLSRNIHSLTFVQGFTKPELISFMRLFNMKPQRIRDLGGFEKVLESEGIKNIQANKVKYGIINEDGAAQGTGGGDQALFSQLLVALSASGVGAGETAANIEKSIQSGGHDSADAVYRVFQMVAQNLPALPAEQQQQQGSTREKFLQMFRSFSPEMQGRLLLTAVLKGPSPEKGPLDQFYHELKPEELEASILASLQHSTNEQELQTMLLKLSEDKGITLSESVKKKIMSHPSPVPEVKRNPWDEILAKEFLSTQEIETAPEMLDQMIHAGALAEADRLSKKLFGYLATGTKEQKIFTITTMPSILAVLSQNEKWKSLHVSLNFLLNNCFRKEAEPEVVSCYIHHYLTAFGTNFEAGKWRECQDEITQVKSRTVDNEYFRDRLAEELKLLPNTFAEAVRQGGPAGDHAVETLKSCDRSGAAYLFDLLAEEEDQKIRKRLLGCIDSIDQTHLMPEIQKRLSDSRWYVVRNMVTILGKMASPEASRLLERAATHPDPKVAKEVVKRLYGSTAPTDEPIVVQLMTHADKAIRMQAVHLASMLRAATATPILVQILTDKNPIDTDLRAAAYQTILRIKPEMAVGAAMALLERKAAGKAETSERNAAVRILGEVDRQNYRPILQKVATSDSNPETRQTAQTYL